MVIILRFLAVSLVAGWIVGRAARDRGYHYLTFAAVGLIGNLIGHFLFGFVGFPVQSTLHAFLSAVLGGTFFLWIISFITPWPKKKETE